MRFIFACLALAACDSGGILEGPGDGGNTIDGIAYTAEVREIVHDATSQRQLTVFVTLTNTTNVAIDRHYPAGCPVRIRLYRALDNALLYDESRFECVVTTPVPISIPPRDSRSITSGVRFQCQAIFSDSVPAGAYNAAGLVRLVGQNPVEVQAGEYVMAC